MQAGETGLAGAWPVGEHVGEQEACSTLRGIDNGKCPVALSFVMAVKRKYPAVEAGYFAAFFRDSDRIQTCNRLIRSQVLYSVELRSHISRLRVQR